MFPHRRCPLPLRFVLLECFLLLLLSSSFAVVADTATTEGTNSSTTAATNSSNSTTTSTSGSSSSLLHQPQQSMETPAWTVVIDYTHPYWNALTIYDRPLLTAIQRFEQKLVLALNYSQFCLKNYSSSSSSGNDTSPAELLPCVPPLSVVNLNLTQYTMENVSNSTLQRTLIRDYTLWRPCVGAMFPYRQTTLRSFFYFGGPLANFTSVEDRASTQAEIFMNWFTAVFQELLFSTANESEFRETVAVSFRGGPFQIYEAAWDEYKLQYNLTFETKAEDTLRFQLFKDNAKRLEYFTNMNIGLALTQMNFPALHLTNQEFLGTAYTQSPLNPSPPTTVIYQYGSSANPGNSNGTLTANLTNPPFNMFLFWSAKLDMFDFKYPP